MIILILTLTTMSIAASFLPTVRKWEKSYDADTAVITSVAMINSPLFVPMIIHYIFVKTYPL